jgi:transposase
VAERRALWRVAQAGLDPEHLVFIDESWVTTNMARLRGRAMRGQRVIDRVPHGHWKTTTLISALDLRGIRCSMDLDGAVNRLAFEAFLEHVLLANLRPGDLVILDNLSSHKGPRASQLVQTAGAQLMYLPPYSPDLNPIENLWSKVKGKLRSLAARSVETLHDAIGVALGTVTPNDCVGFFRHCGYAATSNGAPL